jgi:hypothetical protein
MEVMEAGEQELRDLKGEYILLQNLYEDFDRRSLAIKGWIAAGAVAAPCHLVHEYRGDSHCEHHLIR